MAEKKTPSKPKALKLEFVMSPTGLFKLGYNVGDVASFESKQAETLIESGVAKKAE
jgi:hypothetical protein